MSKPHSTIKLIFSLLFVSFLITVLTSCSSAPESINSLGWLNTVDIYMGGGMGDSTSYWKNGESISLNKDEMHVDGVAISGEDTYLAGFITLQDSATWAYHSYAIYRKNGKITYLTDGKRPASATAIAVLGTDVYVAGQEDSGDKSVHENPESQKSVAMYWKNGLPIVLTDGHKDAKATAVAVKGNDVYVVGYEKEESNVARYWKNGKQIPLQIGREEFGGAKFSEAYSIFLAGNDVYIAGSENSVAVYWKNGRRIFLVPKSQHNESDIENPSEDSKATSIAVSGTNVYVAGIQDTLASLFHTVKYWKNGKAIVLTKQPFDAKTNAFITLNGTDVYLACTIADPDFNYQTIVWKNNTPALVSKSTMRVTSIVVKNKP